LRRRQFPGQPIRDLLFRALLSVQEKRFLKSEGDGLSGFMLINAKRADWMDNIATDVWACCQTVLKSLDVF
jgi:hypothetical protein